MSGGSHRRTYLKTTAKTGGFAFTQTLTTPADLNSRLLNCGIYSSDNTPSVGETTRSAEPPPRISPRSRHYRFALYVLAGYPYEDACQLLNVSPRTSERWRTELRAAASRHFGRRVTYEFAARCALDPGLRRALEESVRGSPQGMP